MQIVKKKKVGFEKIGLFLKSKKIISNNSYFSLNTLTIFPAEFEDACAELNIPLIVLPRKKPQYNGGVERGNRIFREEFYNRADLLEDSVRGMQAQLAKAVKKYNAYRPHRNLQGLTPMQYIQHTFSETSSLSHFI